MAINILEEIFKSTPKYSKRKFDDSHIPYVGEETPLKSKYKDLKLSEGSKFWNAVVLGLLSLLVILVFIGRAFVLQVVQGEENYALSEGNRIRAFSVPAERGAIFDRNGEFLVRNKPAFILEMNTSACALVGIEWGSECKQVVQEISNIVEVDVAEVFQEIDLRKVTVVVSPNLTKEEILPLEANIKKYPSLSVTAVPQRDYMFPEEFAHVIGYVGYGDTIYTTIEGKTGVEQSYNEYLSGTDGSKITQTDSTGQSYIVLSEKKPTPGRDLNLYIDAGLQRKAFELLKDKVDNSDATGGAIVAQDPNTGGVLAMVSYPSYNPNTLVSGISQEEFSLLTEESNFPFFNRAISAVYPPASVFKMVMASAVLGEGVVGEYFRIFDPGYIQVGEFIFRNWKLDGHGDVDLRRAVQVSNDTYFYTVGGGFGGVKGLGIGNIHKWATAFGFGKVTGVDIFGEVSGNMPDGTVGEWYLGDTYITSIGQGDVLATPIQLNNLTTFFANGGKIFKPMVVKDIEGYGTNEPEVLIENIVDNYTYEVVRDSLNMAVEPGGTGYPLFDFPDRFGISLAGKTGTAEFGTVDNEVTHAWFSVFGPYGEVDLETYDAAVELANGLGVDDLGQGEAVDSVNGNRSNSPRRLEDIAITVFLEEGGSGSSDAAPIAREMLEYWFGVGDKGEVKNYDFVVIESE